MNAEATTRKLNDEHEPHAAEESTTAVERVKKTMRRSIQRDPNRWLSIALAVGSALGLIISAAITWATDRSELKSTTARSIETRQRVDRVEDQMIERTTIQAQILSNIKEINQSIKEMGQR